MVQSCTATSHRTDRRFCGRTGHAGAKFLPWEWGAHGGERGGLQLTRCPQVGSQMDAVVLQGSWEHPGGFILCGACVQLVLMVRKNPGDFFALFWGHAALLRTRPADGEAALMELLVCCINSEGIDQVASSPPLQAITKNSLSRPPCNRVYCQLSGYSSACQHVK